MVYRDATLSNYLDSDLKKIDKFVTSAIKLKLCLILLSAFFIVSFNSLKVNAGENSPDLPNTGIPGFNFPEPELTLNNWLFENNVAVNLNAEGVNIDANIDLNAEVNKHAWGIWTGLTMESGILKDGAPLRVFETYDDMHTVKEKMAGKVKKTPKHYSFLKLQKPHQFQNKKAKYSEPSATPKTAAAKDDAINVSVAYSPSASKHAVENKLFYASSLNKFLSEGYEEIPNFPISSISVKPVYKIIPAKSLGTDLYTFPVWTGPVEPPKAYDESIWPACVHVDVNNNGKGNGEVDDGCVSPTPQTTYNLKDFIHNKITNEDAKFFQEQLSLSNVVAGDYVILVAMHVGTREMKRWTWQTFWWSATPDYPNKPSSNKIAAFRPSQLKGAARHYAMSAAYKMINPIQPLINGKNEGTSLYVFNPYLEAGFDPTTFQIFKPIKVDAGEKPNLVTNEYGVQTNCMTCHNLAVYDPTPGHYTVGGNRSIPYSADTYISLNDKEFHNKLKLDFAWSILGNLDLTK